MDEPRSARTGAMGGQTGGTTVARALLFDHDHRAGPVAAALSQLSARALPAVLYRERRGRARLVPWPALPGRGTGLHRRAAHLERGGGARDKGWQVIGRALAGCCTIPICTC